MPSLSSVEPPPFIVESTLFSLCSRSDPHFLTKVQLSLTLTFSPLTTWCSELMALFLFLLAKAALAFFPTALFVALRPLFLFQHPQYAQVSLLKSAPFCTLFSGLGSTNKSAASLLFSFYLTLALSSPFYSLLHLSFYHNLSGRSGRNCRLSSLALSGYNGSPDICFSRGTTRLMTWPVGEHYSSYLQFLVVSLVLFFVSTPLFSRTGSILSHLNISTHRFPRFLLRNLCSLVTLAVFFLIFAAMGTAHC